MASQSVRSVSWLQFPGTAFVYICVFRLIVLGGGVPVVHFGHVGALSAVMSVPGSLGTLIPYEMTAEA